MITEEFYQTYRNFAKEHENIKYRIYDDGFGVPTIGIGFALINKVKDGWKAYNIDYLKTIGITLTAEQHKILTDYAISKSEHFSTRDLKQKLDKLDFSITPETVENLLHYSIDKKYDHISNYTYRTLG